jgi:hypothetical protein
MPTDHYAHVPSDRTSSAGFFHVAVIGTALPWISDGLLLIGTGKGTITVEQYDGTVFVFPANSLEPGISPFRVNKIVSVGGGITGVVALKGTP